MKKKVFCVDKISPVLPSVYDQYGPYRNIILKDIDNGKHYKTCVFIKSRQWDLVINAGRGCLVSNIKILREKPAIIDGSSIPAIEKRI